MRRAVFFSVFEVGMCTICLLLLAAQGDFQRHGISPMILRIASCLLMASVFLVNILGYLCQMSLIARGIKNKATPFLFAWLISALCLYALFAGTACITKIPTTKTGVFFCFVFPPTLFLLSSLRDIANGMKLLFIGPKEE